MGEKVRNLDVTTTSMNKIDLNNLVVSMRHIVSRCKASAAQKLTRQIKTYRSFKGSEAKAEKGKRKSERLAELLQEVKPLRYRAMVCISCQKPMQKFVEKWRKEHADWRSLSAFLTERVSRRMAKRKKMTQDDIEGVKMKAQDEEEVEEEEKEEDEEEEKEEDLKPQQTPKIVKEKKIVEKPEEAENEEEEEIEQEKNFVQKNENNKAKQLAKSPAAKPPIKCKKGAMIVKKLNLADWGEGEVGVESDEESESRTQVQFRSEKKEKRKLGSLFVGFDSGSEEEEIAPSVAEEEEPVAASQSTFIGSLTRRERRQADRKKDKFEKKPYQRTPKTQASIPAPKIDEKLHPSWLASKKRKMETTIQAFQGTKKTFED
ncbi:hypothetical protein CAPTEDRAFT_204784 [Capitella teleta]|uniref:Serum response factor-binding protein 1 n=1 Tax=Capitella teleta TaxID=283909 RepID=R7UYN2_CAPTE|nr:hypothetical protein CAPTEDRAFT_204784 [Capitella teleta]|eukprot:ELU08531.1 hypothetical protein CAPTEDRAFT_204784 [Capitella teleta]